jgi:hypothetical protein
MTTTNWTYQGQEIQALAELPGHERLVGFVYLIRHRGTGEIYIGKKQLYTATKKKVSQREIARTGTRQRIVRGRRESDWKRYYGSARRLAEEVKGQGPEAFEREILELCCTKKYLGYAELVHQLAYDVLGRQGYNDNILGKYYRRDMANCACQAAPGPDEPAT